MKLIEPQAIRLLSSTVPENDAPAWDADTAYEIGDSVIHEHRVYKAVADSTGKQPDQHSEGTDAAWRHLYAGCRGGSDGNAFCRFERGRCA